MQFNEAVKKSIKNFMDGNMPEALTEQKEFLMYGPDYFDELEAEILDEPTDSTAAREEEESDEV